MAPEHLEAFQPGAAAGAEAVGQPADLFSLGVVLFELLTGERPFAASSGSGAAGGALAGAPGGGPFAAIQAMAAERRAGAPSARRLRPEIPGTLERAVRRCLEPAPEARFESAKDLAQVLDGCRQLRRAQKELPPPGLLARAVLRRPLLWLVALAVLPHLVGSSVNISYNAVRIAGSLSEEQRALFPRLVLAYNAVMYPLCLALACLLLAPLGRTWKRLARGEEISAAEARRARRRALSFPLWVVALSALGWLPGGALFPLALHVQAGPLPGEVFQRFLFSFSVSGLIALAYSFFGVQFVALRAVYFELWPQAGGLRDLAAEELRPLARRSRWFQLLAGLIPLAGAVIVITVAAAEFTFALRLLVVALIALGMAGFWLATAAADQVAAMVAALAGRRPGAGSSA
jgi:hypothetical protein